MQIYLVGGAVRDAYLGLPVHDRDWVVTGATPAEMLDLGYQQVGRDFPVFLHPQSKEEYALARTERKSGQGYHGFICDFSPETTLEQDLIRRDLTINAMAQAADGRLIDPYGGLQDLQKRLLRHVSPAFSEDPLRVLRLLRFGAKFAHLGFEIAEETWALAQEMATRGELQHLSKERIWLECEKALSTPHPEKFFQGLFDLQLGGLLGVAAGANTQAMVQALASQRARTSAQAWALFWQHEDHKGFFKALPVPKQTEYWVQLVHDYHEVVAHWEQCGAEQRLALFRACGALKGAGDLAELLRLLEREALWPCLQPLQQQLHALQPAVFMAQGYSGSALGDKIRQEQLRLLSL